MISANTQLGARAANGSRDAVSLIPTSLGQNTILRLTAGSLPLPTSPGTG